MDTTFANDKRRTKSDSDCDTDYVFEDEKITKLDTHNKQVVKKTGNVSTEKEKFEEIKLQVLKGLASYSISLVRSFAVEPDVKKDTTLYRNPTLYEVGEDISYIAFNDWQHEIRFDSSRPESSALGKQGHVNKSSSFVSNNFLITTNENWNFYRYKVKFFPQQKNIDTQREILMEKLEFLGPFNFDGTSIFSIHKYDENDLKSLSNTNMNNLHNNPTVTLLFESEIQPEDHEHQYLLQFFLRYCLETYRIGNDITPVIYRPNILYSKFQLENWYGYEIAIQTLDGGIFLNITPFYVIVQTGNILDFFNECLKNDPLNYMDKFKEGVINKTIMAYHDKRKYVIYDVIESANLYSTYIPKSGNKVTCVDYYQTQWDCKIKKIIQPILVSKKFVNYTNTNCAEDEVYLIPELCMFTGLKKEMRKNPEVMKLTECFKEVNRGYLKDICYNVRKQIKEQLSGMEKSGLWSLKVSDKLVDVLGHRLVLETVYSKIPDEFFKCIAGDWTLATTIKSIPMYKCSLVKSWIVLSPEAYENNVHDFIKRLTSTSNRLSLELPEPEVIFMKDDDLNTYLSSLEEIVKKEPSFILCVLTCKGFLNDVQRKLCVDNAVPSQVILADTLSNKQLWVCRKVVIQINCKLGGAPWIVDFKEKGLLIVGLSVSHGQQNKDISYGGMVATMNDMCSNYFSCVEPLVKKDELWKFFAASIGKALVKYKEKNGMIPNGIVIYKHYVEDGQTSLVHKADIELIKDTCKQFYEGTLPLAFIVADTQSSTIIFQSDSEDNDLGNPLSGYVFDGVVTDPKIYDFYLASSPHYGPNSKYHTIPTHYKVIEDTLNDWSPEKMQTLTYKLTYMYYNRTFTIQVPAPIQYAKDLVGFAANTIEAAPNNGLEDILYFI